ncbi:nitrite reductase small subunit NirD [Alteromonas antoniana]|uniref:nitrite reductase small subunit NirD n=1 Tax=Alteromonas antoniana TaxID=2803813 RepID=UPI001C459DFD|nr:nitrite reductase small subunit NirD [Alteromonas antoniana]
MQAQASFTPKWHDVCDIDDLVTNSGVCALVEDQQVALFLTGGEEGKQIFAISNWDPVGQANVLYRGILGTISTDIVVASPLYKEHYVLETGKCVERNDVSVAVFPVRVDSQRVLVQL